MFSFHVIADEFQRLRIKPCFKQRHRDKSSAYRHARQLKETKAEQNLNVYRCRNPLCNNAWHVGHKPVSKSFEEGVKELMRIETLIRKGFEEQVNERA